ncbi:MAG: HesA/MoeB/ThiF family protein [Staphylothermus sp.]|nr:HesA/MoeB/ThiF family protein [Staphylothermus sp.]
MSSRLTKEEIERYSRQIMVFGEEGQVKLKSSTVLVAGVGGLGSPVSYYLVAAGIGKLIIIDEGVVELSNLQRQILYTVDDIGKPKVFVAAERLRKLNPNVEIVPVHERITEELLEKYIKDVDVVVDALDNWETRIILDKVCYRNNKPFVHAGVEGFYGQMTFIIPGKTPCLRCIFPIHKQGEKRTIPIVSTTPGILGVLEANEVLKYILGMGEVLANKLLIYNGLYNMFEIIEIKTDNCKICYE